jgi:hypothetical protein
MLGLAALPASQLDLSSCSTGFKFAVLFPAVDVELFGPFFFLSEAVVFATIANVCQLVAFFEIQEPDGLMDAWEDFN